MTQNKKSQNGRPRRPTAQDSLGIVVSRQELISGELSPLLREQLVQIRRYLHAAEEVIITVSPEADVPLDTTSQVLEIPIPPEYEYKGMGNLRLLIWGLAMKYGILKQEDLILFPFPLHWKSRTPKVALFIFPVRVESKVITALLRPIGCMEVDIPPSDLGVIWRPFPDFTREDGPTFFEPTMAVGLKACEKWWRRKSVEKLLALYEQLLPAFFAEYGQKPGQRRRKKKRKKKVVVNSPEVTAAKQRWWRLFNELFPRFFLLWLKEMNPDWVDWIVSGLPDC